MSPRNREVHLVFLTVIADAAAILTAVVCSYLFRFYSMIPFGGEDPGFHRYAPTLLIVVPVFLWSFRTYGLYQMRRHIRRIEEIFLAIKGVTLAIIALMAATFFYRDFTFSRIYLVILWGFAIFFVSLARYYLIQWEYARKRNRHQLSRVLLLGANRNTRQIIKWAQMNPHYGEEMIGVLSRENGLVGKHIEGVSILGALEDCEGLITRQKPDKVVLLEHTFSRDRVADLVMLCEDLMIDFKMGADIYGLITRNVDVEYVSSVPLLGFRALPLDDFWNRLAKRTFDITMSFAMILASSPVWILAMLAIKLADGGSIFYRQERMGRDMKVFNVLKFRTMRENAEQETGPVWAQKHDSRKTRIGNFLRRTNLDELPQLLNVLRGDMSLVGPRPERPHFIEQFRESIPRYMARHRIKSGLTGWAAVNGYRGNTSITERTKYDLYYMENWSLLFDIEILLMTVLSAKTFKNAY